MVTVKKRDGRTQEYLESKIGAGVKKAGASVEEAARVTRDVAEKVAHKGEVSAEELSGLVVASLRKVNKKASEEFVKFRDNKLKAKKNVK